MTETGDQAHRCGFVAIIGRTNVGKSTLLNRLVGEKLAIVTPVSQTTRHRILGVKNLRDGQIIYLDTPGFHKPKYRMNRDMVQAASDALREADVVLCVIDAATGVGPGDRFVFSRLKEVDAPIVLTLNKIDRVSRPRLLPLIDEVRVEGNFQEIVPVSATEGTQCAELEQALLGLLPEHSPLYPEDYLTDQPERLLAAEMIREQVLLQTRQEIPHAVSVIVERYVELHKGSLRIEASIYVERESQRAIVVGKNGQRLKEIGTCAREEIGRRFERPASVFLWVKVHPDWRQDAAALERWRRSGMASG
jgi:GTP-binding protein Era